MATIEGNAAYVPASEFRPKIVRCLSLLRDRAGSYSTWFDSYNLKIRAAARSGANFGDDAIDIARPTFNASDAWLASVIIHETIHFWQYRTGNYQAGRVAETEANRYQLGVLRSVGGSAAELAHLQAQTGDHADRNGDGVYDQRDYEDRDY